MMTPQHPKHPQHPRVRVPTLLSLAQKLARPPAVVRAGTPPADALAAMAAADADAVAVVADDGGVVGIFSARDHARGVAAGGTASIQETMRRLDGPIDPALPLRDGVQLMAERGLHHLPVVENGQLLALLSGEEMRDAILAFDERVFYEMDIDWKMLWWRGVYSC